MCYLESTTAELAVQSCLLANSTDIYQNRYENAHLITMPVAAGLLNRSDVMLTAGREMFRSEWPTWRKAHHIFNVCFAYIFAMDLLAP